MNICVTVNSKYERYLYIMLVSLYESHPQGSINLFVIQRDFTSEDKQDITELSHKYFNQVTYIKADPHKFDGLRMSQKGRDNLSLEIYFRLLIPEFLPESVDRVLMLDVDIVVLGNLQELYNIDFSDCYLAAAPNMCHNGIIPEGWRKWYGVERKEFTHYNTGILLWNLQKIREELPKEYIFKEAWNHPIDVATFEEELFNVLFGEDGILEVPAEKYNYICTHEDVFDIPNFKVYKSNEEVKENVSIVHYAALNPWQGGIKNDKFKIWWEVCKKTKYYHQILEETYEIVESYLKKRIAQEQDEAKCKINELTNKLELESKKLRYIDLLLEEDGRRKITERLRKLGWNRFVVYGASRIARCLANLFKDSEADILCYVDKNYQGIFLGKECVRIEQIKQYESLADCIIVSNPYYYDEIVSDVREHTELMILSVDDLLGERELFSELAEYGKIINHNDNWFILGEKESYKRQEDLLAKYGICVKGRIIPDELDSGRKDAKYVILDKDHIKLEHSLLEKGLKYNRDFIVLSNVFVGGYDFTNAKEKIEDFDNRG